MSETPKTRDEITDLLFQKHATLSRRGAEAVQKTLEAHGLRIVPAEPGEADRYELTTLLMDARNWIGISPVSTDAVEMVADIRLRIAAAIDKAAAAEADKPEGAR